MSAEERPRLARGRYSQAPQALSQAFPDMQPQGLFSWQRKPEPPKPESPKPEPIRAPPTIVIDNTNPFSIPNDNSIFMYREKTRRQEAELRAKFLHSDVMTKTDMHRVSHQRYRTNTGPRVNSVCFLTLWIARMYC